jgi:malate dehydrogenase
MNEQQLTQRLGVMALSPTHDVVAGSVGQWTLSFTVGSYGIDSGIVYSYPVRCRDGNYEIVQDLSISDFSRSRMVATETELREERAAIESLL